MCVQNKNPLPIILFNILGAVIGITQVDISSSHQSGFSSQQEDCYADFMSKNLAVDMKVRCRHSFHSLTIRDTGTVLQIEQNGLHAFNVMVNIGPFFIV